MLEPGPEIGAVAVMRVTVTDDLAATFDDEHVHPVYGTASLVRHIEQVSRRLLVPHLAPGEEGVGVRIEATHHRPVPVGRDVELTATVTVASPRRLVTAVVARSGRHVVARGTFEQAVVDLATWRARSGLPS